MGDIFLTGHIISRMPQEELIVPSAHLESTFSIAPSKLLSGWLEKVIYVTLQIKCGQCLTLFLYPQHRGPKTW